MKTVGEIGKRECCGCKACSNVCPVNCIAMPSDKEGFWYPQVDLTECIKCGKCTASCPAITPAKKLSDYDQKVYACWNKDADVRINSTSGGAFSALASRILEQGGYIVGAKYRDDFTVEHAAINKTDDLILLRQSKYMQSDTIDIFRQVKVLLDGGNKVLFCGTPCHNAALRKFLKQEYDKLTQIDFICRGVISPKVFTKYLDSLETKYQSKATKVHFKNKRYGWNTFSTQILFENGTEYIQDRSHDPYMVSYLKYNIDMRTSCHECKYKGIERFSDVTLGDFWGISNFDADLDDNKGTSLVIVNSKKGEELIGSLTDQLIMNHRSIEEVIKGNLALTDSPKAGVKRTEFFSDIDNLSFDLLFEKYCKDTWRKKISIKINNIVSRAKLLMKRVF